MTFPRQSPGLPIALETDPYDAAVDHTNLTKDQLLVWAGEQVHREHRQYSELVLFHIYGPLDTARFRRAFDLLVDCSDALRTSVRLVGEWPQQVVVPRRNSAVHDLDLSDRANAETECQRWLSRWSAEPFAGDGPLIRTALIRLGPRHFVWALHQHQLIADGWSFGLVFKRVREFYAAGEKGAENQPPSFPQFRDYVDWERRYRRSPACRRAAEYWARKLSTPADVLTFYGGCSRSQSNRVRRLSYELNESITAAVRRLAERLAGGVVDLNMFTILCTACAIYVARVCGVENIAIGVPYANRASQRFKDTMGSFMHLCPLRFEVRAGDSVLEVARRVHEEAVAAARYQQYAVRNPIKTRHYEVVVNYHKPTLLESDFNGWRVRVEWPTLGFGNSTLALQVRRFTASGTLGLDFDLSEDVFGEEYGESAVRHCVSLLEDMLRSPVADVYGLRIMSETEELRIRNDVSAGKAVEAARDTLPAIVRRRAEESGERLAVIGGDRALTYNQLEEGTTRVAGELRRRGVRRGEIVAIALERGVNSWLVALGILKTGAAYLPLEIGHPTARLRQILRQASCRAVVVSKLSKRRMEMVVGSDQATTDATLIDEEELIGAAASPPPLGEDVREAPHPTDVFYVIFTSGSTGTPKGIAIEHRGMANHVLAKIETLGLGEHDRVAQAAPMSFDVSVWQFFAPLCVGGQVHVIDEETTRDPRRLLRALEQRQITVAATVPSMLRAIVDDITSSPFKPCDLRALRWLVVTGEVLPPDLCRRWLEAYPQVPIVNAYGPSECSDDVTHYVLQRPPPTGTLRVPIGKPIRNTQVWVLDDHRVPVPIGVTGELWVGGIGVGRGYLADAERTAAAFFGDRFTAEPEARLYRTGDLGWYRPDGNLEFAGRRDEMVKIRGQRVEPGEIEAALRSHPSVRDVVVTSEQSAMGTPRLVAHVVLTTAAGTTPAAISAGELRRFIALRLPDFMVPSRFVFIDRLPLTANGKVDRRALPVAELQREDEGLGYRGPRTRVEQTIAAVWSEVLDVRPVGIDDNLFALGGDSLLAAHIAYRVRERLLVDVPVHFVLENPTVESLAVLLEKTLGSVAAQPLAEALAEAETMSDTEAAARVGGDA